jgi:hypothetical protein
MFDAWSGIEMYIYYVSSSYIPSYELYEYLLRIRSQCGHKVQDIFRRIKDKCSILFLNLPGLAVNKKGALDVPNPVKGFNYLRSKCLSNPRILNNILALQVQINVHTGWGHIEFGPAILVHREQGYLFSVTCSASSGMEMRGNHYTRVAEFRLSVKT